jgi:predicted DNA repair protein MutK
MLGLHWPAEPVEHLAQAVTRALGPAGGLAGWLTTAVISGVIGVIVGGVIAFLLHQAMRLKPDGAH